MPDFVSEERYLEGVQPQPPLRNSWWEHQLPGFVGPGLTLGAEVIIQDLHGETSDGPGSTSTLWEFFRRSRQRREQTAAILAAPDRRTWSGHRDAVLLATTYNTGACVSEITALRVRDVPLDRQTPCTCTARAASNAFPLRKSTATELRAWLGKVNAAPEAPAFPNRCGAPMSRSGVRDRLERAVAVAERDCSSLRGQRISPHTLRHSTAMHLLQSGTC